MKPNFEKCCEYRERCWPKASQPISVVDSFNLNRWICCCRDSPRIIAGSASACVAGHDTWPVDCVRLDAWKFCSDIWTWLAGVQSFSKRPVAEMATRLVDHPVRNWLFNRVPNSRCDPLISHNGNPASDRISSSRIGRTILRTRPNSRRTDRRSVSDAAQSSLFLADNYYRELWGRRIARGIVAFGNPCGNARTVAHTVCRT